MKLSSYIRLQAASVGTTVAASAGAAVAAEAAGVAHASILLEFNQGQFNSSIAARIFRGILYQFYRNISAYPFQAKQHMQPMSCSV
jgi:hypothetical protein